MPGPPRPPTLADVAARAGVSRALVSIVLRDAPGASDATRLRVRAVADELGYRPDGRAQLLAGRRTRLLGVTLSLRNPFHADVTEGIYRAAERAGYQVVLSAVTGTRDARAAVDSLLSYRCEAVLVLGSVGGPRARTQLAELAARQPVLVLGQPSPVPGADAVRADDAAGMRLAVRHLAELGHRRIVHVDGARAPAAGTRRAGYRTAMRAVGLAAGTRIVAAGEREEDGAEAARTLVDDLPDAVITYNDRCAVGVLDVFARAGVAVPEQVSLVGYDDSHVARLPYLRLTTISQDTARLAALAVRRVARRLDGAGPEGGSGAGARDDGGRGADGATAGDIVLAPHLVLRGTTAGRDLP